MTATTRPRLVPDEPLPPYAFVPGRFPHPVSDPAGHSHDREPAAVAPLLPDRYAECRSYLIGIDLFNHGYYWEAHETWERLWIAAGRVGPTAWLLQGLIKLAAAGVKVRESRPAGTASHADGALALFERAREALGSPTLAGLAFADLIAFARAAEPCQGGDIFVFPFVLIPRRDA